MSSCASMKSKSKNWWSHNGVKTKVQRFIDCELKDCKHIYVHPLVNDHSLGITVAGSQAFCHKIK